MSRQTITFAPKETYAIGDIAVASRLTICMRCVAIDADGEPLFKRIDDVSELGSPGTGVIPSGLIEYAVSHGSAQYQVVYRDDPDHLWEIYGYNDRVTYLQAQMVVHNAKLNCHDDFEIIIEPCRRIN